MTAEMITDNSDEILDEEDNSDEIGDGVDDVHGDEGQPSEEGEHTPESSDEFWHGNPEELPEELRPAYKSMQRAFTKKMQRASSLEDRYISSIDAANAAVLARAKELNQAELPATKEEEIPPDLADGSNPQDVIAYYVKQEVERQIKESGVDQISKEMQPVAQRERVVSAYRSFADENPKLDHTQLAPLTGQVIDADDELSDLASVNPAAAIRLASRIARAELAVTTAKAKTKKKRQAAPVSARSGTVIRRKPESMLEAATRALKEAGFPSDSF